MRQKPARFISSIFCTSRTLAQMRNQGAEGGGLQFLGGGGVQYGVAHKRSPAHTGVVEDANANFLRRIYGAAIAAASPALCVPPNLPKPGPGRNIVIGAGKAAAAMAAAVEAAWDWGRFRRRGRYPLRPCRAHAKNSRAAGGAPGAGCRQRGRGTGNSGGSDRATRPKTRWWR